MLEHASLLLYPWQHQADFWTRPVADGATRAQLGRVRWLGRPSNYWLSLFRGPRLELVETEDDSLLLTVVQPWGPLRLWDVYDADEGRVGSLFPPVLLDNEGLRRGFLQQKNSSHARVLSPHDDPLADFESRDGGEVLVTFADAAEPNPFLRMLLLGTLLALHPAPTTR